MAHATSLIHCLSYHHAISAIGVPRPRDGPSGALAAWSQRWAPPVRHVTRTCLSERSAWRPRRRRYRVCRACGTQDSPTHTAPTRCPHIAHPYSHAADDGVSQRPSWARCSSSSASSHVVADTETPAHRRKGEVGFRRSPARVKMWRGPTGCERKRTRTYTHTHTRSHTHEQTTRTHTHTRTHPACRPVASFAPVDHDRLLWRRTANTVLANCASLRPYC
jgi:hypothetical protein